MKLRSQRLPRGGDLKDHTLDDDDVQKGAVDVIDLTGDSAIWCTASAQTSTIETSGLVEISKAEVCTTPS